MAHSTDQCPYHSSPRTGPSRLISRRVCCASRSRKLKLLHRGKPLNPERIAARNDQRPELIDSVPVSGFWRSPFFDAVIERDFNPV
jgi:hypothetical protein